ncbi:MAG: hypothetical protein Q8J74_08775 [Candidatus Didemnitutus sp.]|nr:hypothetical protein [Candidatus Didemnitutus sp.]
MGGFPDAPRTQFAPAPAELDPAKRQGGMGVHELIDERIARLQFLAGTIAATGPNNSSSMAGMPGRTPVNTVAG